MLLEQHAIELHTNDEIYSWNDLHIMNTIILFYKIVEAKTAFNHSKSSTCFYNPQTCLIIIFNIHFSPSSIGKTID